MGKRILANEDLRVATWVAQQIPIFEFGSTPYTAVGLAAHTGELIAGVVFQNYIKTSIEVHIASVGRGWATREFLGECCRYPFLTLGCARMTGLVPAGNEAGANFDEHFGFKLEGRIRKILPNGDDLLVYGMLREECRWLNVGIKHGYQHSTSGFRRRA